MQTEEFFERVRTAATLDDESAARDAALATLETPGEPIGDRRAELLAADLSDEYDALFEDERPDGE